MGMQQKLSAVGLYFLIILVLYGRKEIYPKVLYKAWEATFKEAKRDPAESPEYGKILDGQLGQVGHSMDILSKKLKEEGTARAQKGQGY